VRAGGATTGISVTQGGNVLGLGPVGELHREMHWRTFYSGKEGPPLSDIYLTKPWEKK
ncbi:MAG: hypothetical protein HY514_01270, partial [Candidatus Aenigmarchaeota archaeon]|nr:hypothetical protein [Candidatus Aenigmarchaeota archaeon]